MTKIIVTQKSQRTDGSTYENEGIATITKFDGHYISYVYDQPLIDPVVNATDHTKGICKGGGINVNSLGDMIKEGRVKFIL